MFQSIHSTLLDILLDNAASLNARAKVSLLFCLAMHIT